MPFKIIDKISLSRKEKIYVGDTIKLKETGNKIIIAPYDLMGKFDSITIVNENFDKYCICQLYAISILASLSTKDKALAEL